MQEKFALRKTLRKVAAVGTSIAMVGVTLSGALAAGTLGDYPSPFNKNVGETVIVFGSDADNAAVQDVLAGLPGGAATATTTTTVTPGKVVYGLNSVGDQKVDDLFRKGDKEDLVLGTLLNDSNEFGNKLQDNQIDGLLDSTVRIDIGSTSDDYNFHEEVYFNGVTTNTSSVETGLTFDRDEKWKENVFVQIPGNSFGYRYKFDKTLKAGNYLNFSSSDDPIDLQFLGQNLEITAAANTSLTANVGTKHVMAAGDSVVVNVGGTQRTVTLKGTSSANKADVEVDGVRDVIPQDSTRTFRFTTGKNVQVRAEDVFDEDGVANDRATLIIGEDARKTYNDGDEYIGEDKDDPIWVWNLAGLRTGDPTLEVQNSYGVDNWREDANPLVKHAMYKGDYFCMPNNYICLVFESMSEEDENFQQYTIEADTLELSDEDGDSNRRSGTKVLIFRADGASDRGFKAGDDETDAIAIAMNASEITLYRKEQDGSEYIRFNNRSLNMGAAGAGGWGSTFNVNFSNAFNFDYKSTSVPVDILMGNVSAKGDVVTRYGGNITIDFGTDDAVSVDGGTDGNLIIKFENSTTNGIEYFGSSDSDTTTANDIRYNHLGTLYAIEGKEENMRTKQGVIIYDPKADQSGDRMRLAMAGDVNDYKANIRVARPKEGAVEGGGVVKKAADVTMKDSEVTDLTKYNAVVVGGPCVNKATRQLLNMAVDTPVCGTDSGLTGPGEAVVEMKANGAKQALLVWGWEADDTRRAAVLLKDPTVFKQKLTEAGKSAATQVTVKGTDLSLSGITVA
ncbi:MAG TPA: hypothetical protein VJG30_00940 [Candidatus Nanoarchaeia archaeon]|nr:hypothetical protein [Candidatus Nanoarchaeia archaeon]